MKNTLLVDRRNHFQWVFEQLNTADRAWYLEKDWFDTPTLISKEDAKREVVQIEKLLNKRRKERGCYVTILRNMSKMESRMLKVGYKSIFLEIVFVYGKSASKSDTLNK